MSTNVFANGKEVAAKKSDNQSIAAMPDVCLSPPSPPAGPIPIPYPNFSAASDMADGTKTVKIAGDEVGMKDQSNYKTSKGDEAATKSLGMGVVTHGIQGKTFFAAWSSDVMFEGANAVRFMDMTTGNHSCDPPNSADTTVCTGTPAPPDPDPSKCKELEEENEKQREALSSKSSDKTLVGPDDDGTGTTMASSEFVPSGGGSPTITSAHNNQKAHEFCEESLAKGGEMSDRKEGKSGLCPEAEFNHAAPCAQKSGHSEARTFDELGRIGKLGPGLITFNIDWRPKKSPASKMPCQACHKMMCAAAEKCEIRVFICDKDNKPHDVGKHCPASPQTYAGLQEAMGEAE